MRQLYKTGHANSVLDGKQSERLFDAIDGERKVGAKIERSLYYPATPPILPFLLRSS